jgi:hypothetical protein
MDLRLLGRLLKVRWLWLQRTESSRSWALLPVKKDSVTQAFFQASIRCEVGDGASTFFWSDPWLQGRCI